MRTLALVFIILVGLSACSSADGSKAEEVKAISEMESQMRSLESLDTALATKMIEAYQAFISEYPKDSLSPYYQKKTAEMYRAWPSKEQQTIEAYEKLMEEYTYHEEGIRAILSLALFYEEKGLKDQALAAYQHFIDHFPSHSLADQARQLQELLANEKVTDIQMVQDWMKKAKDSGQKESNSVK